MPHARLAPSSAHRWLICPGSIAQASGFPNRTTDAAELGTALHTLSQMRLEGNQSWDTASAVEILDQGAPEPDTYKLVQITDEHREWVRKNTDWAITKSEGGLLECEVKVNPGIHFGVPDELWGTSDVLIDLPNELVIADFKYGTGHVDVEENPQLLLYAIGAAERYGWRHPTYRLVILQPRTGSGEARDWLITRVELLRWADEFRPRVIAATRANAPLVPSEEGCRWCPAAGACAKLQERTLELTMRQFQDPRFITDSELLLILGEAKRLRIALDAAEEYAQTKLACGEKLSGWKRVASRTNREWGDEARAVEMIQQLGKDPWDRGVISPAAAEKLLGPKLSGLIAPYITRREGSPTLAPESDRRPALPADV